MKVYLVGGAVRDSLLDVPVKDRDWVVVGATHEQMMTQGYQMADPEFPVYHHPESKEEYALARKEEKTEVGYRGFELIYTPDVTLEEDLARRDLTINAMAQDPETGKIIDPFNGQEDLHEGLLKHVTNAFVEDPIRVLRIARFAARFGQWGFKVAHGTHGLLKKMVKSEELEAIIPERLWQETERALADPAPDRYFHVLNQIGAIPVLFPELQDILNPPQAHQAASSLKQLKKAAKFLPAAESRFAVLAGLLSIEDAQTFSKRLPMPKRFKQLLISTVKGLYQLGDTSTPEGLVAWVQLLNGLKDDEYFCSVCEVIKVIDETTIPHIQTVMAMQSELRKVKVAPDDLARLKGAEIGKKLAANRIAYIQQQLASMRAS